MLGTNVEAMISKYPGFIDPDKVTPVMADEHKNGLSDKNSLFAIHARWLYEPDMKDRISASHFRKIFRCSCGELKHSLGMSFVEISICGESFMLHQVSVYFFLTSSKCCIYIF